MKPKFGLFRIMRILISFLTRLQIFLNSNKLFPDITKQIGGEL